jgi:DNA mismatch repair protein MutS
VASNKIVKETPLMKQYNEIKKKVPDACLLFRVGDFMKPLAKMQFELQNPGIVLTKRGQGSETGSCWFPTSFLEYLFA